MGMVLWLQFREAGEVVGSQDDYAMMGLYENQLTEMCRELEVQPLTAFYDTAILQEEWSHLGERSDLDDVVDEPDFPEALDGYQWFESQKGITTVQALLGTLARSPEKPGMYATAVCDGHLEDLREELEDCLVKLQGASAKGRPFHFAVVP